MITHKNWHIHYFCKINEVSQQAVKACQASSNKLGDIVILLILGMQI